MAHGNVYALEKVDAALGNYFRVGNLTALRELALLWLADSVDDGLQKYREAHGIAAAWETRERVVVALTGGPEGDSLIRRAARIAARATGGELIGVHIARSDGLSGASPAALTTQRLLLESLGGSYHSLVGDDVTSALLDFARASNATQIVIGASRRRPLNAALGVGVGVSTVRRAGQIDVHVVGHDYAGRGRALPKLTRGLTVRRRLYGLVTAAALLTLLTLIGTALRGDLTLGTDLLLYLLAVVVVSLVGGFWPALLAAVVASLLLNFYFVPPIHQFTISEPENVLSLTVFVLIATMVSRVVDLAADRTSQAARSSAEAETLSTLAGSLLRGESALPALLERVRETFSVTSVTLLRREGSAPVSRGDGARGTWSVVACTGPDPCTKPTEADTEVPLDDELSLALRGRVLPAEDQRVLGAFASQVAVAYRQRQLMEAAEAAVPLAESDRMRTALLNAVSHDLRTPLATAKAALSGLSDKNITWSPEDEQELLTTAGSALDRLTDLVTNLLDLSRLQAGVLSVFPRSVGLDDVVSAALAHVAGDHTIDLDVPASLPEVLADPGLLERVVANLVQNAVRHSPPQAAGRVAGSYHDGRVELRVIDRGPGIPAAAQGQVFEPFQRLHDHATSEDAGVGLGLAIARGFAEAMAGDLVIEDTPGGPDHGRRHARLASPGAVLTRVLVVDDEPQMLRALHLNLTARGYDVVTAEDGTSALNEVAISEPDVIVLDLGLPDIDGLEVIRAIRTGSQVPILVLSARIGSSDKVAALDLGADDFVTKPFDMNELLARLRAATRRTAPEQSRRGQVQFGGTEVDLEAKTAARDGASVHLTPTEWHLLELLLRNPGKLITQRHLLTALRGQPDHTDPSYLRIYMAQLRKKLEAEPGRPKHLLTEPGMGYRFHV